MYTLQVWHNQTKPELSPLMHAQNFLKNQGHFVISIKVGGGEGGGGVREKEREGERREETSAITIRFSVAEIHDIVYHRSGNFC
jgi:hypothetical protein